MCTVSFPVVKCGRGRAADHSPSSSAAVMEEYSYTSTHPLGHTGPVTGLLYLYILLLIQYSPIAMPQPRSGVWCIGRSISCQTAFPPTPTIVCLTRRQRITFILFQRVDYLPDVSTRVLPAVCWGSETPKLVVRTHHALQCVCTALAITLTFVAFADSRWGINVQLYRSNSMACNRTWHVSVKYAIHGKAA